MLHIIRKIGEVGIKNTILGGSRVLKYKFLRHKYHFNKWHESPYELRKYLQEIAAYINQRNADVVVDIGCGFGEMLRHINAEIRIGYDIEEKVIEVAKMLDKTGIVYYVGSFNEVNVKEPIDYLVTLGFAHGSREDKWKPLYHNIAMKNEIKHFIIDTVPEGFNGACYLDYKKILPDNYKLVDKLGPFLSGRVIEIYEKMLN